MDYLKVYYLVSKYLGIFQRSLLVISNLIPLGSENTLGMIWILLILFRLVLWPRMGFPLVNIQCVHFKMCILLCGVYYKCQLFKSIDSVVQIFYILNGFLSTCFISFLKWGVSNIWPFDCNCEFVYFSLELHYFCFMYLKLCYYVHLHFDTFILYRRSCAFKNIFIIIFPIFENFFSLEIFRISNLPYY